MQNIAGRLVVLSLVSAVALAGCGGSTSRTVGAAAKQTLPGVTTTTVVRRVTNAKATTVRIDLSGTPGVTSVEQGRAEKLVRDTIVALRRYARPSAAYAAG